MELVTEVADALMNVIEPAGGQIILSLYEYVNPDALEDIITASTEKKSDIEVRFMVEDYLITVRSDHTVLIYEPIRVQRETSGNRCPAS